MAQIAPNPEGLSLGRILSVLNARKALILVLLLLTLVTAAIVTAFMPRWYLSTAMIRVQKPEEKVSLFQAESQGFFDPYFTQEQLEILRSKQILYQVIEALDLQQVLGNVFAEGERLSPEQAYRVLRYKMLDIESAKAGTALIDVGVWAREDPELAAAIANAIAQIYAEDRVAFAVSDQMEGIARLKKELEAQEAVVNQQRDTVERLRSDLGVAGVDLDSALMTQEVENLRAMERTLVGLRVEAIGRKSRWENFMKIPVEDRLKLVNSELIQDSNIKDLLQAYLVAQQQVTRLRGQLGEAHPDLRAAQGNLTLIEKQLNDLLDGYAKSLEMAYLEAQARVSELEGQIKTARLAQIASASEVMRPFEDAVEKLREEERIYQTLKLTLRQREIDFQAPKKSIEILNPAEPAGFPERPSWLLNMLLAFIAGGALGVGVALLVEFMDTSFRSIEELETQLGLPILGVVPREIGQVSAASFTGPEAEPYRVIQTNLDLAAEGGVKILAVQSAGPGEGKSTTLYNLAAAMALSGQKVLLVDSDLRRPTQHDRAEVDRSPGFIEVLNGAVPLADAECPCAVDGLTLLPAGRGVFHLTVLQARRFREMLEDLAKRYDRILLDSPPVIGVSDAAVIAGCADGVLLVVQHRRNPRAMTQRATDILKKNGAKPLGIVLNRVPPTGEGDYNYYTANYGYYANDKRTTHSPVKPSKQVSEAEGFEMKE